MLCPNCGAEVREDAAFCGACGSPVQQPPAEADPGATAPLQAAAPGAAASDAAEYERQMAEYQRQKAAYDQQQYAQQMAEYQQQQATYAQQVPPKKRKTGLIVALLIIALLLLVGCGVGGVFAFRAWNSRDAGTLTPDIGVTETDASTDAIGYATAEEAVQAQLVDSGVGDWVYQLYDEGDAVVTYWSGPPASEWVDEIIVQQNDDGSWSVLEVSSLDFGGDVSDIGPSAEAEMVVYDHLTAVMEDRGLDAQALTVDPFHSDAAAAGVSAGGFDFFDITGVTEQSDGSFWVATTQSWYGNSESWEYWIVPTEAGYRIADIRPL